MTGQQTTTVAVPQPERVLRGFSEIRRYWDKTRQCYAAKLLPGEYYVSVHPEVITTVLGSCVSACIRDPVFGIGGMNHFMLPASSREPGDDWHSRYLSAETRYGTYAMEQLINAILKHGGSREHLEVKLVGGGRVLRQMTDIGRRNIAFVREFVATEGLNLVGEDLGDMHPRKVVYWPQSGRVQVKKLRSLHNDTIIERESHYLDDLAQQPASGDAELF